MPARADIDPADIPGLLQRILLVDVLHDPLDFRIRLAGTLIEDRYGEGMQGRHINELDLGEAKDRIRDQYARVVRSGEPAYVQNQLCKQDGRILTYERLLMPLSSGNAGRVDMLFAILKEVRAG